MKSQKTLSNYAKGSANVTLSLFSFIAGVISFFFNPYSGIFFILAGVVLFILGNYQKRQLKNEMWDEAMEHAVDKNEKEDGSVNDIKEV